MFFTGVRMRVLRHFASKRTAARSKKVDGIFNHGVQHAFKRLLPREVTSALVDASKIGSAVASTLAQLVAAPPSSLNTMNHQLHALSPDPVLGFLANSANERAYSLWALCSIRVSRA